MPRKIVQPVVHNVHQSIVKDLTLCILSAGLLIFSFPNFNIWFLAWFGFVPLFFAIQGKSKAKAFLLSYITGVIFWFGIIYWLIHVTLPGMIILVLYLALYFGIFGLLLSLVTGHWSLVTIPSTWVLLEYLRSHMFTGFPWALLGYSQYLNLPVIQIADITGVWGVSFLIMMVNVVIYQGTGDRGQGRVKKYEIIIACFLLLLSLGHGFIKLSRTPNPEPRTPIKISVIQGNIPQELKWDKKAQDFIMERYLTISRKAAKDSPDLIIWPEAALPCVLEEEPLYYETTSNLAKEIKTPLLLGSVTAKDNLYYNSALLISQDAETLNKYNKLHLVPFGEYIPLRKTFRFLETIVPIGDFTSGKEYTIFELPFSGSHSAVTSSRSPATFSVLICFEDLFPNLSREFVKRGAGFLINITNDAWFSKTSSPYQHLQASVFRAVENRVFLVRSANTGVSGFIAPTGKITSLVSDKGGNNIFISGYRTQEIAPSIGKLNFYTRYGDIFISLLLVFIICSIFRLI